MSETMILVVDDTRVSQHVVRHILQKAGYAVLLAADGIEALEVMEDEEDVALVITDMAMPEMDGSALITALRADLRYASLPVIMMTGTGDEENVEAARSAEADGFLTKPISSQNLIAAVTDLLTDKAIIEA